MVKKEEPDIPEILESLCNIELAEYTHGDRDSEDVGKCKGKECNYCGRYNDTVK